MSNVAIILARGGSKGIKNKNIIHLNGKPLIYWSIKACLKSKKINSVWVSSDNEKILKISKRFGAKTIKRPKKFSKDNSPSELAWKHAIELLLRMKIKHDNVVGIQPTSPIRSVKTLDKALSKFREKKLDSLFSAQEISNYFIWQTKNKNLKSNYNFNKRPMRQNIKPKFLENGSFYIFNSKKFLKNNCRLFGKIGYCLTSKIESFELDDKEDLNLLRSLKKFLN